MIPRAEQVQCADLGYAVLKKHGLVYLAMEERTGKTLTSILIAEKCAAIKTVLVVTKKKPLEGWRETLSAFEHTKAYTVTNYHQVKKLTPTFDLVILDEAHNYISSAPKASALWKDVKKHTKGKPIIYLSATPHAQGRYMLYHQFALSNWSPFKAYSTFYSWFRRFGVQDLIYVNGMSRETYKKCDDALVRSLTEHLFITKTRAQLGFKQEPKDKLHYVTLSEQTRELYNALITDKVAEVQGELLVCDSPMKLRTSLHMLEGGVAKIEGAYLVLPNCEKIDYIKQTWGDSKSLVIFYNYIAEKTKLEKAFKHAKILQATSYAEGIDLKDYEHLVIYSQDFSTARHSQRRARQANFHRDSEIVVHFLLVEKAISEQVYNCVAENKINFVDSVFERTTI